MKITTVLEVVSLQVRIGSREVKDLRDGGFYDIFDVRETPQRKAICCDDEDHETYSDSPERYQNSLLPENGW